MFEYIINSSMFMKAIIACSFLGVISWFVLEVSYRSMIKATAQAINRPASPLGQGLASRTLPGM